MKWYWDVLSGIKMTNNNEATNVNLIIGCVYRCKKRPKQSKTDAKFPIEPCVTDTARKNHCAHKVLNKRFLFVDSDFCQLACCLKLCSARNSIAMLASKESARIGYNPKPLIISNWIKLVWIFDVSPIQPARITVHTRCSTSGSCSLTAIFASLRAA